VEELPEWPRCAGIVPRERARCPTWRPSSCVATVLCAQPRRLHGGGCVSDGGERGPGCSRAGCLSMRPVVAVSKLHVCVRAAADSTMPAIGQQSGLQQSGITVKDVDAHEFVKRYAVHLKKQGKISLPELVDLMKTSVSRELAPYNEDWFFVRCGECKAKPRARAQTHTAAPCACAVPRCFRQPADWLRPRPRLGNNSVAGAQALRASGHRGWRLLQGLRRQEEEGYPPRPLLPFVPGCHPQLPEAAAEGACLPLALLSPASPPRRPAVRLLFEHIHGCTQAAVGRMSPCQEGGLVRGEGVNGMEMRRMRGSVRVGGGTGGALRAGRRGQRWGMVGVGTDTYASAVACPWSWHLGIWAWIICAYGAVLGQ